MTSVRVQLFEILVKDDLKVRNELELLLEENAKVCDVLEVPLDESVKVCDAPEIASHPAVASRLEWRDWGKVSQSRSQ